MASLKMLVSAVDMTVTAPYFVDIAALHGAVRSVGDDAIRQWCCVKSCQIEKFVSFLVKSLFDERGIEIFERFCRTASLSKAVADNYPDILPQLLARALNESNKSNTNLLCCRLLGTNPLKMCGIPADLPRYLEKIMRAIHQFPTTDLLHAIREIFAQQSARIFEQVSEDVLSDFINTCKLLTRDNTSNWHEAAIVSINIGSAVVDEVFLKAPGDRQDIGNPGGSAVFAEWAIKMLGYFDGLKAPRFLHSIVARVMFFTSRNQNIPMPIRARTLDIVFETLGRFGYCIKEFSADNPGAVEKVWRNTAGENLDFDARLSAFTVAFEITTEGTYLDNIEAALIRLVAVLVSEDEPCTIYLDETASCKVKQVTDALCFLLQYDRKPCIEMLHNIVSFTLAQCRACQHPVLDTYMKIRTALVLLQALSESMVKHQHVFILLLNILDKPEFQEWLPWLQELPGTKEPVLHSNCRGSLVCTRDFSGLRDQLCHDFSVALLQGACTMVSNLSTKEFAFLQDRAFSCTPKAVCKKCQYPADTGNYAFMPPPPLFPRIEGDWRQQMLDIMRDYQNKSAEAVLDQANTVYHEFETRCENLGEPPRQAEAHAAQLPEELDRTRLRLDQQESSDSAMLLVRKKTKDMLNEKDIEIETLMREIHQLQELAEKQNKNLEQLRAQITNLKEHHEESVAELCAEAADNKQDLERLNRAEIFAFEEQLEGEKQRIEKLSATVAWLESEKRVLLEEQKVDHDTHQEAVRQLKSKYEETCNYAMEKNNQLRKDISGRVKELADFKETLTRNEAELHETIDRVNEFEKTEKEWLREKSELQERLKTAETKEKKAFGRTSGSGAGVMLDHEH